MIRVLFVAANLLSILALRFNDAEKKVVLRGEFPETLMAGKDAVAEITIKKGTIGDFGRLDLSLPSGVSVKDIMTSDAKFCEKSGSASWIWHKLPAQEQITIRVTLQSAQTITDANICASFFYVANNSKQVATTLATEAMGADEVNPDTEQSDETEVQVLRDQRSVKGDEVQLSITIIKGKTSGFARYSDVLPPGARVESAITDGSSFSVADGKVRFVWVSVPEKDTLRVSYILVNKKKSKEFKLKGEYLYLEGSKSKTKELEPESVFFVGKDITNVPGEGAKRARKENASTPPVKKTGAAVTAPKKAALEYRVQIGAFKNKKVTARRLEKKFKVTGTITSEMHEGFFKFMTGGHAEYTEARDHRDRLKNEHGIKSAFVVAYNRGKRITVQEALMISKQKWHQ